MVREAYDLAGYHALVGASSPNLLPAVRAVLRGFGPVALVKPNLPTYDVTGGGTEWHIRRDGTTIQVDATLNGALGVLEWHLIAAALDHRRDLFHLHGAALSTPDGRAGIVLAGDSGSGKTTLTLALITRGFLPFGDDVTLLDPVSLDLHPLPRSFHLHEQTRRILEPLAGAPLARDRDAPPEYFSPPQWARRPVRVQWLLVLERRPGQGLRLTPMSPSEAAAAVLTRTSSLARTARLALSTCARLTGSAACHRFSTGDVAASAAAIEQLVSRPLSAARSASL